tara:strand:+ start:224 stop:904 length:681 start_codon:yes stop_codon:yes gene_type:complete
MVGDKIFVNGCSWTAGCELEDIDTDKYSNILSKNSVNIADGGRSNDQIVDTSIDWLNNNTCDLAIIQFTFTTRIQLFKDYRWQSIQPPLNQNYISHFKEMKLTEKAIDAKRELNKKKGKTKKEPETLTDFAKKMYYKYIYSKELGNRNFWKNVCHLEMFMKNKKIPYIFWHIGKTSNDDGFFINMSENKNMLNANFLRDDRNNMLCAHPSAKGHQLIAEKLLASQH